MQTVIPDDIISPRALREWQKWKSRLDHPAHDDDQESLPQDAMQDTVGAVAWDDEGNLAAGVSRCVLRIALLEESRIVPSGGLLLKYSGRIGEVSLQPIRINIRSSGLN